MKKYQPYSLPLVVAGFIYIFGDIDIISSIKKQKIQKSFASSEIVFPSSSNIIMLNPFEDKVKNISFKEETGNTERPHNYEDVELFDNLFITGLDSIVFTGEKSLSFSSSTLKK